MQRDHWCNLGRGWQNYAAYIGIDGRCKLYPKGTSKIQCFVVHKYMLHLKGEGSRGGGSKFSLCLGSSPLL